MRKEFVQVETREEAAALCPWASVISGADGGFWAFESVDESAQWAAQL